MKILHYINNLGSGGAEKLLTDILPLMVERGHVVHLAYSNNKANVKKFDEEIEKVGIVVFNFNMSFYNPFQVLKLVQLLKKGKYDIVHAHLFPTQYWLAFASRIISSGTKLIKTEHSIHNRRMEFKIINPLEKWIYDRFDGLIAITHKVKENLSNWLKEENKIVVINNGVNISKMELLKNDHRKDDLQLFSPNYYNILMVGRFNYPKDQISLIKAISYLPDRYRLFFAGYGDHLDKAKQLVLDLNLKTRVQFLGIRTDVYILMSLADLNVLSTNHEGLSGVALESMASGRPFIGTNVAGVNDVVPDDKFLFPKSNPEKLAEKIDEISKNKVLERHLINKGLEHAKKFDINKMVDNYLNVYQLCLDGNVLLIRYLTL